MTWVSSVCNWPSSKPLVLFKRLHAVSPYYPKTDNLVSVSGSLDKEDTKSSIFARNRLLIVLETNSIYIYMSSPKLFIPLVNFDLTLFNQQVFFLLEMTRPLPKDKTMYKRHHCVNKYFSAFIYIWTKSGMSKIIHNFSITNRKAFIGYCSNQTLPIIAICMSPLVFLPVHL